MPNDIMMDEVMQVQVEKAIERMADRDIYLEITAYFLTHLPETLGVLRTALHEKSSDATRLAHSLKTNCATVGAEGMRGQCARLEELCSKAHWEAAQELFATLAPLFGPLSNVLQGAMTESIE